MSPPSTYTPEIADRILRGLSGGRSLRAICNDPTMPPPSTVLDWVREDRDGFAARYQEARELGNPGLRSYTTLYTDAIAERMLGELRRGRALRDVCEDDGMPAVGTVTKWVKNDREGFAVRYIEARLAGHALMTRWTCYTPEIAELILDEMSNGRTLTEICSDPGMPSIRTVYQWAKQDREGFKALYHEARDFGCYTLSDQLFDIARDSRNDWTERRNKDGSTERVLDHENIKRSQLVCDVGRWRLSRMLPKAFGDRVTLNTEPEVRSDLAELMKEINGRSRGLPSQRLPAKKVDDG
jgi:hypothetical protein